MAVALEHILKDPKSGRLSFRRAFPATLRAFVPRGRREHKVSLRGRCATDPAVLLAYSAASAEYDAIASMAERARSGSWDTIDAPTIAYLAKTFEVDMHRYEERQLAERGSEWADKAKHGWEWMLDEFRQWRVEGDLEAVTEQWGGTAKALLADKGVQLAPDDQESLRALCKALNDTVIAYSVASKERIAGNIVAIPEAPSAPARRAEAALSMLPLFDAYAVNMTPGIRQEWRRGIEKLIAFVGHDDARRLTADNLMAWRDHLLAEPLTGGGFRDPKTVKGKYIGSVKAMLGWAVQERKLAENVSVAVTVRVPKKLKARERNFTQEEATAILAATLDAPPPSLSAHHARARRWIPWLCAYTGARVNEMGQLRREDVQQVDGLWMIRINPEAGTVKGGQARIAPIHEHLVEQGFLSMVDGAAPGPLFYDPEKQRVAGEANRHYKKVGERLAKWVRDEVGITDKALMPNHAWRHTFKTLALEADMQPRIVDAIVGHAARSVGDTYGSVTPKARAAAITKFPRFDVGCKGNVDE